MSDKTRHPDYRKLHLYTRPNSSYWWCQFFHKSKPFRATTKQSDLAKAYEVAGEWYEGKLGEIQNGTLPTNSKKKSTKPTIKDASIIAINDLRASAENQEHSKEYYRSVVMVTGKYISITQPKDSKELIPGKIYWGDIPCDEVTNAMWKDFKRKIQQERKDQGVKPLAKRTFHQIRNALNLCLRVAEDKEWIDKVPKFREPRGSNQVTAGRAWFEPKEQTRLLSALNDNIQELEKTRHHQSSMELRDYVEFMLFSGLRVGESRNVEFRDVEIVYTKTKPGESTASTKRALLIKNIVGKRGVAYECLTRPEAAEAFDRIKKRRCIKNHQHCEEPVFLENHRTGFNAILMRLRLKQDRQGRRRDFVSLRHSYICNMIRNRVSVFLIATNCRTSVDIIEKHYAAPMKVSLNAAQLLQEMDKTELVHDSAVNKLF